MKGGGLELGRQIRKHGMIRIGIYIDNLSLSLSLSLVSSLLSHSCVLNTVETRFISLDSLPHTTSQTVMHTQVCNTHLTTASVGSFNSNYSVVTHR